MSILAQVSTGKVPKPPIIGLHAKPGLGKSTWAAQAPAPLFVTLEEGTNQLDVARTPLITDWPSVISTISELINEPHAYRTVVFDTIDMMEMLIWKTICERDGVKSIELANGGYGKGLKEALEAYWPLFIDGIRTLRDTRNVGTIMLCHSIDRECVTAQSEAYLRSEPKLFASSSGKVDVADYLIGQCDAWGYFGYDVKTVDSADKDRKLAKGGTKRIQHWEPAASHLAKNRYGIVDPLPLNETTGFADFLAAMKG